MKSKTTFQKSALFSAVAFPVVFLCHFLTGISSAPFAELPATWKGDRIAAPTNTCTPFIECRQPFSIFLEPLPAGIDADGDGDEDAGAVPVPFTFLVVNATSECSDSLHHAVYKVQDIESGVVVPHPNDAASLVLTCDDGGNVLVRVYVWDDNFNPDAVQPDGTVGGPNYNYCETNVFIETIDPYLCVPPQVVITGLVETPESEALVQVAAEITHATGIVPVTPNPTGSGSYNYLLPTWSTLLPYTVTPKKDVLDLNGLSGFDLILIKRHLLGVQPLGNPYKMIAADVNNDKKITNLDLIHIQALILGLINTLPANTSWRFVRSDYTFPDPTNPWQEVFPESATFMITVPGTYRQDFVAIKIGDVNSSAQP